MIKYLKRNEENMAERIIYNTQGTCSKQIIIDIENDIVQNVEFIGGCNGNLQGISNLTKGMNINDVIAKLQGITCGMKSTSCPDQFAKGLIAYLEEKTKTNV